MKEHFGKYLGPTLIDEAEPLTAWRTWRLGENKKLVGLYGTWASNFLWERDGVATVARCLASKSSCNVSMQPDCNCGLWAAVSLSNLLNHGAVAFYPDGAIGRVRLWGFVHVYEHGFRASMGRPTDLWLGNARGKDAADVLARDYGMPVSLGLPVELLDDPGLLPRREVLARRSTYLGISAAAVGIAHAEAKVPAPARPPRMYRCSGCGQPGTRKDRCVVCSETLPALP